MYFFIFECQTIVCMLHVKWIHGKRWHGNVSAICVQWLSITNSLNYSNVIKSLMSCRPCCDILSLWNHRLLWMKCLLSTMLLKTTLNLFRHNCLTHPLLLHSQQWDIRHLYILLCFLPFFRSVKNYSFLVCVCKKKFL